MNDDLPDRDGLPKPMTKTRQTRLREVKVQLSEVEKRKRDALLLAAVEIMRQVR
jgi:hypothetical protein